jgi:hypothetical protein
MALLIIDLLRKHLLAKEALFNKEFGYKKYGDELRKIESQMSQITTMFKVYFGLLISKQLINSKTPQTYIDFIEGDLKKYAVVLQNYALSLRQHECKEFWVTPYNRQLISKYCGEIHILLYENSLQLVDIISSVDRKDIAEEYLNNLHLELSEKVLVLFKVHVDAGYNKYQDLCEELLK